MGAAVVGVTCEILCTTFFARTGMRTREFMRYSAHVSGGAPRSERLPADALRALILAQHEQLLSRGARDRASEAAAGQAAAHAVWAEVGEAGAADRAVGVAAGGAGIEAQRARAQAARAGSGHTPLRLLRQRNPRAALCPIICRDKRARHEPKETVCPQCQGELRKLGEDVSEMLEYVPASFVVIRHVRTKLSCTKCDCIVQAEAPSRPIERGMAGPGLLAHVLVAKYCDHLAAVSAVGDLRASRCGAGTLDAGRLGGRKQPVAGAAGGSAASLRDGRRASCTPTTRRCRCWLRARARPRPGACGPMFAMIVPRATPPRPRCGLPTRRIAKASIPSSIWRSFAARCRPMPTRDSISSTKMAASSKPRAGRTCGASSTIWNKRTLRRWRGRR